MIGALETERVPIFVREDIKEDLHNRKLKNFI